MDCEIVFFVTFCRASCTSKEFVHFVPLQMRSRFSFTLLFTNLQYQAPRRSLDPDRSRISVLISNLYVLCMVKTAVQNLGLYALGTFSLHAQIWTSY